MTLDLTYEELVALSKGDEEARKKVAEYVRVAQADVYQLGPRAA